MTQQTDAGPEQLLLRALDQANLNALRMALFQSTGDPELARMRVCKTPVRGGALVAHEVDPRDHERLKEIAIKLVAGSHLPADSRLPTRPEERMMMELFTGDPLSDIEYDFGREELALDPFPREACWTSGPVPIPQDFEVAIIGAGASGIAIAVQFERLGIPYRIYERQLRAGGTWNFNDYPDLRVDTTTSLYQFKFVKNFAWTEHFATQAEVRDYLEKVISDFHIEESIEFGLELAEAIFDDRTGVWDMKFEREDGSHLERNANVIVSAVGLFNRPKLPALEGLDKFDGRVIHSTDWDYGESLEGKTVAIIGNGSTGVQLMPPLSRVAADLYVFQRTPQWISPMPNYKKRITPEIRWLYDNVPYYWNWSCYSAHLTASSLQECQEYDSEWRRDKGGMISERNDILRKTLTGYIKSKVSDPKIIAKVLPNYAPLARRLVVDNGWYDALQRKNVHLVTDEIKAFSETSVHLDSGREIPLDFVVVATGFDLSTFLWPTIYLGSGGAALRDAWSKDGPRAYMGLVAPGFPNLFMMYGPNAQVRSGSTLSWIEIWSRYAAQGVVHILEKGLRSIEVRRDVFERFNRILDAAHDNLIWDKEGPVGRNYYVNKFGRQNIQAPFRNERYFEMVKCFNSEDFIETPV